jgi:hypothetical protein
LPHLFFGLPTEIVERRRRGFFVSCRADVAPRRFANVGNALPTLTILPNIPLYCPRSLCYCRKFGGKAGKIRSAALDKPRQYAKIKKICRRRNILSAPPSLLLVSPSTVRVAVSPFAGAFRDDQK